MVSSTSLWAGIAVLLVFSTGLCFSNPFEIQRRSLIPQMPVGVCIEDTLPCVKHSHCCSKRCNNYFCEAPPAPEEGCYPDQSMCVYSKECCSGFCNNKMRCAQDPAKQNCVPNGYSCVRDDACCSGDCTWAFKCVATRKPVF